MGTGGGMTVVGEVKLAGTPCSVASARRFLRGLLPEGDPVRDDLVLVGSETVGNAITHTDSGRPGGQVVVALLMVDGVYRLEVVDDGAGGRRPCVEPERGAESGRGLRIVGALAARWGFREDGLRTVVWAEFGGVPGRRAEAH